MSTDVSNSLRKDVVYNYVSTVVVMLMPLISVKYYLINFGGQNWGVISFVILIQLFLAVFDAGMGQVLIREFSSGSNCALNRFLIKKLERLYLFAVGFAFLLAYFFHGYLIEKWMRLNFEVGVFVVLTGVSLFVFQIYGTLYKSFLVGAGFQRMSAVINAVQVFLLHAIGIFISFYFSDVYFYFLWMILSSGACVLLRRFFVFRQLSDCGGVVDISTADLKKKYYEFFKVSISVAFGVALTHLDKVVIGALLDVEMFGYYMVAASLAIGVVQFVYPIGQSFFPYLVAEKENKTSLFKIFKKFFLINCAVSFIGLVVFFAFGKDIVSIWLGDKAGDVYPVLFWMILGTAMAPMGEVFYISWLVFGKAKYIFVRNFVSIVFVLFGLKYIIYQHGFYFAGAGWVFTNIVTLVIGAWSFFVFNRAGLLRCGDSK